jgi:hypothetical protein
MKAKKTRHPIVSPHFDEHVEIARLDVLDGVLSFYDSSGAKVNPSHVEAGTGYIRESGKLKTVNQGPTDGSRIELDPNAALTRFDWLFAIDTAKNTLGDCELCVAASVLAYVQLSDPVPREGGVFQDWSVRAVPQAAYVFRNPRVNPERVGWRELVNRIRDWSAMKRGETVGVIVDSELSQLAAINRRAAPMLGDHYLPDGFELLYASSDVGLDHPQNKLLRICDRMSSRVLKYVAAHQQVLESIRAVDNLFIDGFTTVPSQIVLRLSRSENS